ncbi:hypothetical protein CHL67_08365 [Prosthecochloris sp. GSB1]|nr:hypothetical protein CHL67_08365 [Prosthecochloris sp. GSB1]
MPLDPHKYSIALLDCLTNIKEYTIKSVCKASLYSEEDVLNLWGAAERFVQNFPVLVSQQKEYINVLGDTCRNLWPSEVRRLPWGTILVCIPANAIIPLAIILPLALAASGNRIVFAFSQKIREIGIQVLNKIETCLGDSLFVWEGTVRDVVDGLIEPEPHIDLLYYMGGSSQYPAIAEKCARNGVDLHYEGEGRTIALLDHEMSTPKLYASAQNILLSKVFCNGMMCSSPNAILVHRESFSEFTKAYESLCEGPYKLSFLDSSLADLRNKYGTEKPKLQTDKSPCFWEVDLPTALNAEELFCPGILVAAYDDIDECINIIAKTRHKLQISLFAEEKSLLERMISRTGFARYCLNMNPALQDPCLPWGNYGSSGFSDVSNFYEKGLRKVIIEGTGQ